MKYLIHEKSGSDPDEGGIVEVWDGLDDVKVLLFDQLIERKGIKRTKLNIYK